MTLTVQTDDGTAANANGYLTVAEFKTYHTDRKNAFEGGDPDIAAAIVNASTYLDTRFRFRGRKLNGRDQSTEWPRASCYDRDRNYVNGVPKEVKNATAEYALRAMTTVLAPDPVNPSSGTAVKAKSEKVGPLEESVEYIASAVFTMPVYPVADRMLTQPGLTESSNDIRRA